MDEEANLVYAAVSLNTFPLGSRHAGLSKYTSEQVYANVTDVRVRYSDGSVTAHHKLVLATRVRSLETQLVKCPNEVSTAGGSEGWH